MHRSLLHVAIAAAIVVLFPDAARADNCSSLQDCLETAGFNALLSLFGGLAGLIAFLMSQGLTRTQAEQLVDRLQPTDVDEKERKKSEDILRKQHAAVCRGLQGPKNEYQIAEWYVKRLQKLEEANWDKFSELNKQAQEAMAYLNTVRAAVEVEEQKRNGGKNGLIVEATGFGILWAIGGYATTAISPLLTMAFGICSSVAAGLASGNFNGDIQDAYAKIKDAEARILQTQSEKVQVLKQERQQIQSELKEAIAKAEKARTPYNNARSWVEAVENEMSQKGIPFRSCL
jgi:hypothetical protein